MKTSKAVLTKILGTMVDEWGLEEVANSLSKLAAEHGTARSNSRNQIRANPLGKYSRPTAVHQVQRALIAPEKQKTLLALAERFDRKEFLPRVSDVREFLIMRGQQPAAMKDRAEAFRALLRLLKELPLGLIDEIISADSHSGPSQLGPLSEAIAAAGSRMQRQRNFEEVGH